MTLVVEQAVVARQGLPLIQPLNFTLQKGQAVALVGVNGVGKTTLLRALTGFHPLRKGRVRCSVPWTYVGLDRAAPPALAVEDILSLWAMLEGQGGCLEPADPLKISPFLQSPLQELSAGQQQRVALTRLVVSRKPLWILDEPFQSLDKRGITLVKDLIQGHLKGGGMALMAFPRAEEGYETLTVEAA
jgi:heme exporter protein A